MRAELTAAATAAAGGELDPVTARRVPGGQLGGAALHPAGRQFPGVRLLRAAHWGGGLPGTSPTRGLLTLCALLLPCQVVGNKPKKTLEDIVVDLCPGLSIQQLYRISTMYWDERCASRLHPSRCSVPCPDPLRLPACPGVLAMVACSPPPHPLPHPTHRYNRVS
jgi:hypothetical protein